MCVLLLCAVLSQGSPPVFPVPVPEMPKWAKPGMCGANCLYLLMKMLSSSRRIPASPTYEDVAQRLPARAGVGTSLSEIEGAAAQFGLPLEGRRVSVSDFPRLPRPFIAHLDQLDSGGTGHFIVIYDIIEGNDTVLFVDGANGQMNNAGINDLASTLSGFVLVTAAGGGASGRARPVVVFGVLGVGLGLGFYVVLRSSRSSRTERA